MSLKQNDLSLPTRLLWVLLIAVVLLLGCQRQPMPQPVSQVWPDGALQSLERDLDARTVVRERIPLPLFAPPSSPKEIP